VKNTERFHQREKIRQKKEKKRGHWDLFYCVENVLFHFLLKVLPQLRINDSKMERSPLLWSAQVEEFLQEEV